MIGKRSNFFSCFTLKGIKKRVNKDTKVNLPQLDEDKNHRKLLHNSKVLLDHWQDLNHECIDLFKEEA